MRLSVKFNSKMTFVLCMGVGVSGNLGGERFPARTWTPPPARASLSEWEVTAHWWRHSFGTRGPSAGGSASLGWAVQGHTSLTHSSPGP